MDTLRSVAHLQREIGEDLFNVLVSSDNTDAVRRFAQGLVEKTLPTEMTVGGRTYEILGFLQGEERLLIGHVMVRRARSLTTNLGKEDGEYILKHQDEIPGSLRGKVNFVFPDWRNSDNPSHAYYISWHGNRWVQIWGWIGDVYWHVSDRVLRRKKKPRPYVDRGWDDEYLFLAVHK